ncbi:MAG: helix-turn-helix domain-containing protein, partial [Chloroflexota bacterium]|nr:helix-turn-helix domain-containing protein [Chloroflexota bacterium]
MDAHEATFSERLRHFRLRAGLSQVDLAERANLSPAAVATLERGVRSSPYPRTVDALATALNLPSEERAALIAAAHPSPRAGQARAGPPEQPVVQVPQLPVWLTSFVGRDVEVEAVRVLLHPTGSAVRLLTLLGPAGVGKTRLAVAVAAAVEDAYPDGVAFVDLAPLSDQRLVPATMARALHLRESGERSARELLLDYLRSRQMLLVLDNFEHLPGAAPLLAELLAGCPELALLVTSRAALRLRGEQRFLVPPLPAPTDAPVSVQALVAAPAVRLFVERAQAVAPDFVVDATNAGAVAAICRRLDGLPLAIELAAARTRLLQPRAMLARLGRRLPLLTGGERDLPTRQRTLSAAIEWSYDLLDQPEQTLFRRLAVFVGGCTLDALETVCGRADAGEWADPATQALSARPSAAWPTPAVDVLDGVASLVDNSLLRQDHRADGEARFALLETIREYALERLQASGEADALRRRHADYYLALAEEAAPRIVGPEQVTWLDRLEAEQD